MLMQKYVLWLCTEGTTHSSHGYPHILILGGSSSGGLTVL